MAFATTTLATIAAVSAVAGLGMSVMGGMQAANAAKAQGRAQQQASDYAAKQAEVQAGQERAAAQRRAIAQRRQTARVQSSLQARAAASGAGALDPSIIDLTGDIAQEGEYRALTALYEGEERARGLENRATLSTYEGAAARAAGNARASSITTSTIGTALSSASSLFMKYGGGGPDADTGSAGFDNYHLTKQGSYYG
jgi:hypothetical protein